MRLSASVTTRNGEADKLLNFHIGMHSETVMQEYDVLWNVNVLFGEDKHRFFKAKPYYQQIIESQSDSF